MPLSRRWFSARSATARGSLPVAIPRHRIVDIRDQMERAARHEGVDQGRAGIRNQHHVRSLDPLEAADAAPVEADPLPEGGGAHLAGRERKVLPRAQEIGELDVHHLHLVALDELLDRVDRRLAFLPLDRRQARHPLVLDDVFECHPAYLQLNRRRGGAHMNCPNRLRVPAIIAASLRRTTVLQSVLQSD